MGRRQAPGDGRHKSVPSKQETSAIGIEQLLERTAMESLLRDLKLSARSLRKQRGFTAVAVLTLMLGIGANTTIFSTVDALLLHPYSFPNQDRLVVVWEQNRAAGMLCVVVLFGFFFVWRVLF